MRRALVVVLVALAMPAVLPATPAAADTTFKAKGPVVTITLQVDVFAGRNVRTGPDGTPIDEYFKKVVEDTWGEAFKKLNSLDCYKLELNLDFELFDVNKEGRDGSHKLYVGTDRRGWKGVGWDGAPKETSRNGDGDGTRSFENDRKGDIPVNAPPYVVAHEFGHLLGLGDDRKDGAPKPGYGLADVMVGGVPGTDVNQTPVIDTKVLDRIGKVLKEKGLPKCQSWNGPIRTTYLASFEDVTCTAEENGTVTLGVVDGEVSGTIEASGSETCTGAASSITEPTAVVILVAGTLEDGEFQLRYTEVIGDHALTPSCFTDPRFDIPVERGTGSAEFIGNQVPGYTTTCNITVERQADDEPVG